MNPNLYQEVKRKNEQEMIKYINNKSRWVDTFLAGSLMFKDDKGLLKDLTDEAIDRIFTQALQRTVKKVNKSYKKDEHEGWMFMYSSPKLIAYYTFDF